MTTLLVKNIFAAYVFENPDWCFPKYLFRLNAEHENLSKAEYQQLVEKFWDYVERRGDYAKGELPSYAAFFGTGVASGEERTLNAVKQAFDCLKFNVQINKLTTLFVNIIHGNNLFLKERILFFQMVMLLNLMAWPLQKFRNFTSDISMNTTN